MYFTQRTWSSAILIACYYVGLISCLSFIKETRDPGNHPDEQHRSKRFVFLRTAGMGVSGRW